MSRPQSINVSRQTSPVRAERERATSSARPSQISAAFSSVPSIASLTMNDSSVKLAPRPGRGTRGKAGKALVNYFRLDINRMKDMTSYASEHKDAANDSEVRMRITQRSDCLLLARQDFLHAASNYGNRVYAATDQSLVRAHQLQRTWQVDYFEPVEGGPRPAPRRFLVNVVLRRDGDFSAAPFRTYVNNPENLSFPRLAEFVSMINTLLDREVSQNASLATFARRSKFFDLVATAGRHDLGGGLVAFPGYFKSVRDCENGLFLNMNTSACAVVRTGRLDAVLNQLTHILPQQRAPALKGLRVTTTYSGIRERTIVGFARSRSPETPPTDRNVEFSCPQHGIETVQQHFQRAWANVQRPNPNALVIDFGNGVYIPADLAHIDRSQPFRGALSPDQTANMITFACRRPAQNRNMIVNTGMPYLGFGAGGGPATRFGIDLLARTPEMTRVDTRLLPSPSLSFAGKTECSLSTGSWNMHGKKFIQAAKIQPGQITYLDLNRPSGQSTRNRPDFIRVINDGLRNYCNTTATVQQIPDFQHERSVDKDADPDLLAVRLKGQFLKLKSAGVKLVFMLLPDKNKETYCAIKNAGDILAGIQTVCSVKNNAGFLKADVGTVANLMLKVNAKLGGKNWTLSDQSLASYSRLLRPGTMVVGADVVHPPGTAMIDAPSIAAIVSTHDIQFCQYSGTTRLQQNRDENKKSVEVILDLRSMMIEQLKVFQSKNAGKLPNLIIYMRDGVSEAQFTEAILDVELPGIKRACGELYEVRKPTAYRYPTNLLQKSSLPKIMIITTLKRHHTRFYQDTGDKTSSFLFDRNGNPMPGFTVDRGIVAKYAADFYNVSHACIQGTARPCKYVLLYDELKASADEIQTMVFHMCFTFARASKSIGIHPAVRFADLLCDRAHLYFRSVYNPPWTPGTPREQYRVGDGHWPGRVTSDIAKTMFFI